MNRTEEKFRDLLLHTVFTIREEEWLYSKNENRLCRLLNGNPNARAYLRKVHDALSELLEV